MSKDQKGTWSVNIADTETVKSLGLLVIYICATNIRVNQKDR